MEICGFLGGYEWLLVTFRIAIPIILIIIGIRVYRRWDDSLMQIRKNQELLIKRIDEINKK